MSQQLPVALINSLQTAKGFDEPAFIATHESGEQVISVRFNAKKIITHHQSLNITSKVPWTTNGHYLSERPSFTLDPLFHAGAYYVQEASSMFLEEAMRQTCNLSQPLKVLDLCSAPGGKSTLLQSIISEDSLLVSNEVIKTRANILAENITKWGAENVIVTNNDPKDFQRLPAFFDVIVIDAPCSGSGLFRKDVEAINEWSLNNVELCSQRQQRILADVLPSLKNGGTLIYSTCSYSEAEDEEICDWLLLQNEAQLSSIQLQVNNEWNIVETMSPVKSGYGYRFYPDKVKGEGFFIAAFKKEKGDNEEIKIKGKTKSELVSKSEAELLQPYLREAEKFSFIKFKDEVIAFPTVHYQSLLLLQSTMYLKKAGVKMGALIRNELIPDHELVVSTILSDKIIRIELDKERALDYLRRKDISVEENVKGWAIVTYHHLPLGLIKSLPNRINNYYPKEWRIIHK